MVPVINFEQFEQEIPNLKGRLLGLDIGNKTIGLGVSDITQSICSPLETIHRKNFPTDVNRLQKWIKEYDVRALVVGLPIRLNGTEGAQCEKIRHFISRVEQKIDIPILFWDERYSTVAVERTLLSADVSRQRRAKVVDKMAASYILQGFLDRLKEVNRS